MEGYSIQKEMDLPITLAIYALAEKYAQEKNLPFDTMIEKFKALAVYEAVGGGVSIFCQGYN